MSEVCTFVGHREAPLSLYPYLVEEVWRLSKNGVSEFWVGGYGAFDQMAERAVREAKIKMPQITLSLILAYLPVGEQKSELQKYDNMIYPEGLERVPRRYAIDRRNNWIVHNADFLLAYVTHSWGGAATTLSKAQSRERDGKLTIINLGEKL